MRTPGYFETRVRSQRGGCVEFLRARQREQRLSRPMASIISGPGVSPGYAITNFRAHYDLTRQLQLAVQIDNLFNHQYYTAAQLANTALTAQGAVQSQPFPPTPPVPTPEVPRCRARRSSRPGAPRRAWVELRVRF